MLDFPVCLDKQNRRIDMAKPGSSHRKGITLLQLMNWVPDEEAARESFEQVHWPDE